MIVEETWNNKLKKKSLQKCSLQFQVTGKIFRRNDCFVGLTDVEMKIGPKMSQLA